MAEIEESKKADFKEIQNVFESLLQRLEEDYKQSNEKYDREAKALMAHLQESTRQEDDQQEDEWDGERREAERELLKEHEKEVHLRIEVVREAKNAEFKINTRALFERALSSLPAENAHKIWAKYIEYETQYGDLTNLQNLQQRRDQAFAQESKVDLLESVVNIVEKWSCYDINFISEVELGISALQQVGRKAPPTNHLKNTSALFQGIRPSDKGKSLPILGGLNVDNFPRPDLSKWNQYKAEPGMARGPPRSEVARSAPVEDKRENDPRVEMLMVPEAIALLMEALPSKSHFTGPNINADEVLKILLQSPIAIPLTAPRMISIPISEPVRQTKRSGRWDDGDNRPMKRGK